MQPPERKPNSWDDVREDRLRDSFHTLPRLSLEDFPLWKTLTLEEQARALSGYQRPPPEKLLDDPS
jgi:hypothetical protein